MLLVFDSCEHVIEAASVLAERIFNDAPQVHILATSREMLSVEGEQVHRLAPLAFPPEGTHPTADEALAFPAVRLFVERATVNQARFAFSDTDAPFVADICRKLDGIALAIELAAGRVGAYEIRGVATLLDQRLGLLWGGRRTALPRHRTLTATLDWSFDLLQEFERTILRRLSVFAGSFTLEAARSVAAGDDLDDALVLSAMDGLATKSLVVTDTSTARISDYWIPPAPMLRKSWSKVARPTELLAVTQSITVRFSTALARKRWAWTPGSTEPAA
jgi:predicted ATPase